MLQGDMIEHPDYIKEKNLEIDYLFYLTNQIMNPALQFLELVDKNAINIFKEFIDEYSIPKIKKVKELKEVKPIKVKEPKQIKVKETKSNKVKETINIKKYITEVQGLINELNKYELNKYELNDYELNDYEN
jgi:hypothetical protein